MIDFEKKINVITHGDGDGVISVACFLKQQVERGEVCFSQPFLLYNLPALQVATVILDMAVDTRNPDATLSWARQNSEKIVLWVDHHQGGEKLKEILGDRFLYDPEAPSCPELMSRDGFTVPTNWLDASNACDRPAEFSPTVLSKRYNEAFKVSLISLQSAAPDAKGVVEKVQREFIEELLSGRESEVVTQAAAEYSVLMKCTEEAASRYKEIDEGMVMTSVTHTSADVTSLLFAGYKLAKIAVVQTLSAEDKQPITIVATSGNKNLVQAFGLGGNPSRIVLVGGSHEEQLERVKSSLK